VRRLAHLAAESPRARSLPQLSSTASQRKAAMTDRRTLTIVVLGFVLSTAATQGQDRSRYRDFQLGGDLSSVSASTRVAVSEAKTIHQRPALIQELQWRPSYFMTGSTVPQNDPVQQIVFSFYNDQLYKVAINYDRQRTNGLTDADMVEALSAAYGPPLLPGAKKSRAIAYQVEDEFGTPVARWGDADYSVVLYRSSYASEFRAIVTSPRLEALARLAGAQAIKLDEREAPERETARQKKEADASRAAQEKARLANKAAFRP
jgi:hypothetical protein